jgi:anti-anti-sigma factor
MAGDAPTYSVAKNGRAATLAVAGELDLSEMADFRAAVRAASEDADSLCLDFCELTFIDSMGLSALLDMHGDLQRRGVALGVKAEEGPVRRAFELTGLEHLLQSDGESATTS